MKEVHNLDLLFINLQYTVIVCWFFFLFFFLMLIKTKDDMHDEGIEHQVFEFDNSQ